VPAQVKLDTQAATLEAQLQEPVRGIAAGQSLVVYDGERVLAQATVA
jgi:tRNA methyl transferase